MCKNDFIQIQGSTNYSPCDIFQKHVFSRILTGMDINR